MSRKLSSGEVWQGTGAIKSRGVRQLCKYDDCGAAQGVAIVFIKSKPVLKTCLKKSPKLCY